MTFAVMQEAIAEIDARYNDCMTANGATMVPLPDTNNGWTWTNASDAALRTCAPILKAGDDYSRRADVRQLRSKPDYLAFVRCMMPVFKRMPTGEGFGAVEKDSAKRCSDGLDSSLSPATSEP